MKKKHMTAFVIVGLALAVVVAFGLSMPKAETGTISADVEIATAIFFNTGSSLGFGLLSAPTALEPAQEWILDANGSGALSKDPLGPPTSSADLIPGDHTKGQFSVDGAAGATITWNVSVLSDFTDASLHLKDIASFNVATATLYAPGVPGTGTLPVFVDIGGTLEIQTGASSTDVHVATIEMNANYGP